MEEEKDPSPEYIKGFNTGYTMQKHEPDLLNKISAGDKKDSEYFKALEAGKKQYERELLLEQSQAKANETNQD